MDEYQLYHYNNQQNQVKVEGQLNIALIHIVVDRYLKTN
jgi:hypothetical protein